MNEIIGKLKKLKTMIDRGTIHESKNAQRLYDNLIAKYKVNPDLTQETKEFVFQIPDLKCKLYVSHLSLFFGIKAYIIPGEKKAIKIVCTPDEYEIFKSAWNGVLNAWYESIKIKKIKIKKASAVQDSYMRGFVLSNYRIQDTSVGEAVASKDFDEDAYIKGMSDAKRLLTVS